MNAEELKYWTAVVNDSAYHWTVDEVQRANGTVLAYIGGSACGAFVTVGPDGKAECGRYEGAYPCITDALFRTQHTRQFASQTAAIEHLCGRLGTGFLLALTHGRSPLATCHGGAR